MSISLTLLNLLRPDSFQYAIGQVRHTPDMFLDELQDQMEELTGMRVSKTTLWRSLKRRGYGMKKVRDILSSYSIITNCALDI